mmetsp:Transcript_28801/g.66898  ORF Transcript_28801/g.66898 Transcript_28801/m.66898 type:complete len:320 (-) Transcript_28801:778-1737(-)
MCGAGSIRKDVQPYSRCIALRSNRIVFVLCFAIITLACAYPTSAPANKSVLLIESHRTFDECEVIPVVLGEDNGNTSSFLDQNPQDSRGARYFIEEAIDSVWEGICMRATRIWASLVALLSFVPIYLKLLEYAPAITKSVTTGFMGTMGDFLAQTVEMRASRETGRSISWYRLVCVATEGMLISGPIMHYFYDFLESAIPVAGDNSTGLEKWFLTILQVLADALLMDSLLVATFMAATAIMEGEIRNLPREFREGYLSVVKASWYTSLLCAPLQCLTFRYLPIAFRVLSVNISDIVWDATVSHAAYRARKDVVQHDSCK